MTILRALLVGCGGMGNNWARILGTRSDIGIVGLVDVVPAASAALANRNRMDVPRFGSLHEALHSIEVDVVLDTSIPETRRQIAGAAMEAGCHVLSEKPFAASVEEAQELLAISARTGKTHAVMQNRRYLAGTQGMRQFVDDGVIGEVGMVCADFFLGAHFGGFRDEMANVLLLDMAIHTFDQARFMTHSDAVTAWCDEFNLPGSWYRGNASALAVFEMTNGSRFCYRGSWSAQGAATPWEAEWRIAGSLGTAIWDGQSAPYAEVVAGTDGFVRPTRRVETTVDWHGPSGHAGCLDEMVTALINGERPMTHSGDNAKSLGMVLAAIESAATQARVPLQLVGDGLVLSRP